METQILNSYKTTLAYTATPAEISKLYEILIGHNPMALLAHDAVEALAILDTYVSDQTGAFRRGYSRHNDLIKANVRFPILAAPPLMVALVLKSLPDFNSLWFLCYEPGAGLGTRCFVPGRFEKHLLGEGFKPDEN